MADIVKSLGRVSLWVVIIGLGSVRGGELSSGWKAGVARIDTTPSKPVRMAGYASRTSPSQGVAHPLAAKALALADASDHKVVLVTCDIIAFRRPFTNRVTERVKARYGVRREDVVLFASHNHAGPTPVEAATADSTRVTNPPGAGFDNNIAYTIELENKIVDVIGEAIAKMQPAQLSYGIGRAHFALNRREPTASGIKLGKNPAGPIDESVPILKVQTATGEPLAIVFGYACHNTTLRPDMMKIAADFAGFAQDRIEGDYPGAVALFVTGCAGDADPHPFGTLEMAKNHGAELGEAVKFVMDHPAWMTKLSGSLRTAFIETAIHFGGPTDRASYEKRLKDPNRGRQAHAKRMIEHIDQGRPVLTEYPHYSVQAFALGDQLTLVALSGEVVVDYSIRLQKELGGENRTLWVAAYANDVIGYIPSLRVKREGGYEGGEAFHGSTWPTPLADDIESIVVNAAHEVVKKVRGGRLPVSSRAVSLARYLLSMRQPSLLYSIQTYNFRGRFEGFMMGAEPYDYVVPYEPDITAALDKLRRRVFESKEFNGAELDPPTPEAALELTEADGTRSILDISRISDRPDYFCAVPLSAEEREEYFGTQEPTEAMVRESDDFWEEIERGMARYVILYENGEPRGIYFAGYSFD